MRVKCANCGMIYEVGVTPCDFRTPQEVLASGTCPKCKSNAKDVVQSTKWKGGLYETS